jgi:hypothetical protein
MKSLLLFVCVFIVFSAPLCAGGGVNVLGYYAVNNSLDGQPMIDMVNVLRFYPVFAMRDSVDKMNVTIYYGGNIFERDADRIDDGKYWQALLPIFHLGEAIQRMEVGVHFKFGRIVFGEVQRIKQKDSLSADLQHSLASKELSSEQEYQKARNESLHKDRKELEEKLAQLGISSDSIMPLRRRLTRNPSEFRRSVISLLSNEKNLDQDSVVNDITTQFELLEKYLADYVIEYKGYKAKRDSLKRFLVTIELQKGEFEDSLKSHLASSIEAGLTDTTYSGLSVRKSDIVIDSDFTGARILYRNYKPALRHLMALDPAERLGIFRVRYVPFPITRTPDRQEVSLRGPFGNEFTVFEVGLAFGDAIVSGDDFVVSEFSWQRLGIAFAITEKLFSDSAQVIALALTYDFNSYGSIGVGGNFAQHEAHPYVSFGINKKAFEAVLSGLSKLFK